MKKLYRGTKLAGLKQMQPQKVDHAKAYVYATPHKSEAIIYSVKGGNVTYTNVIRCYEDQPDELIERVPGTFEKIFKGIEGRYYELDPTTFKLHKAEGSGDHEYVSEETVVVEKENSVKDVWEYYKAEEKAGNLIIYKYPNLPDWMPKDKSDLIECALFFAEIGIDAEIDRLIEIHPDLKDKITKLR